MNGKGDRNRIADGEAYGENWDDIFRKEKTLRVKVSEHSDHFRGDLSVMENGIRKLYNVSGNDIQSVVSEVEKLYKKSNPTITTNTEIDYENYTDKA